MGIINYYRNAGVWDACAGVWDACAGVWDACTGVWDACAGVWDACAGVWATAIVSPSYPYWPTLIFLHAIYVLVTNFHPRLVSLKFPLN